jgi:small subunit ribosomal protein S4
MGGIKKIRKKYQKPSHPWQKTRIDIEKPLMKDFSLKNKKELWRLTSKLTRFKDLVKALTVRRGKQGEVEKKQLNDRLMLLGLLKPGENLETILGLDTKVLLNRRLQAIVYTKGLARSMSQSRQFIVHRHITINNRIVTSPNYLVNVQEEDQIGFHQKSSLYDIEHPERIKEKPEKKKEEKKEDKKEEKKLKIPEKVERILTEEEKEAKEIEHVLGTEEDREIATLAKETPTDEVKEIITKGKTEMDKLKKGKKE